MYTQCPECLTIFKLDGEDLAAALGSVRCGHCAMVFDALRTVTDQLPPEPIDALPTHASQGAPTRLDLPVFRPNPAQASLFAEPIERRRAAERSSLPAFAAARRRARAPRNWPWLVGSALLLLSLSGEIAWANQGVWINDARVRTWLDPLCTR
ncbi:MAG: zinc-ribbon domain-containing protein, partial [Dokdonella sp.]